MSDEQERGSLEGPPPSMQPHLGSHRQPDEEAAARRATASPAPGPSPSRPATTAGSFDMNQPTIIALLYLVSPLIGVTGIVGVILAFIWRDQPKADWEASHYQYLINTFWIAMIGFFVGFLLIFVIIGILVIPAVMVWAIVRSVMSLINAQKQQPMSNPGSPLF